MNERRHNNQNHENRRPYNNYQGNGRRPRQKPNKGLIIIRSTVFALAIVFVALLATFTLVKNKKVIQSCKNNVLIINKSAIIKADDKSLLLRAIDKDHIKIIRVKNDDNCPQILNIIKIKK